MVSCSSYLNCPLGLYVSRLKNQFPLARVSSSHCQSKGLFRRLWQQSSRTKHCTALALSNAERQTDMPCNHNSIPAHFRAMVTFDHQSSYFHIQSQSSSNVFSAFAPGIFDMGGLFRVVMAEKNGIKLRNHSVMLHSILLIGRINQARRPYNFLA